MVTISYTGGGPIGRMLERLFTRHPPDSGLVGSSFGGRASRTDATAKQPEEHGSTAIGTWAFVQQLGLGAIGPRTCRREPIRFPLHPAPQSRFQRTYRLTASCRAEPSNFAVFATFEF